MLKKSFALVLLFCVLFTGCSAKNVKINSSAEAYLESINVMDSRIASIDFKKCAEYKPEPYRTDLKYVSDEVDDFMGARYDAVLKENETAVQEGDLVAYSIKALDEEGKTVYSADNAGILIGCGRLTALENAFIGKKSGSTVSVKSDDGMKKVLNAEDNWTFIAEVDRVYEYTEKEGTSDYLAKHGFDSITDLYGHIFDLRVGDCNAEANYALNADFVKYVEKYCEFAMSEADLKNYTELSVKQTVFDADRFGISEGGFIASHFSSDHYGISEGAYVASYGEKQFYIRCAESADMEIKYALIIGALAERFNIDYDEAAFNEFCTDNNVDLSDAASRAGAEFYCLANAVTERFISADSMMYIMKKI